jgi:acetyl esterase
VAQAEAARGAAPFVQSLIYPAVDTGVGTRSTTLFGDDYFLSNRDRELFSHHYIGGTGVAAGDPRVSPLRSTSLRGLPPALVVTAGFDILRDEGEAYAAALADAGVVVRLRRFATLGHGFVNMTGITPAAHDAMIAIARDLRRLIDATEEAERNAEA